MAGEEYRYLTFLYYDLVDSTPLSQHLDEESWHDFLSEFLRISNGVIRQHGGDIHDTHGDGALVYFGYPATQRISAVQAVRAGLELTAGTRPLFTDLNQKLQAAGTSPVQLRVGIHSGRVVIGDIDGKHTATGFVLAFTERLHRCAEPNTVILSSETLELVGERFKINRVGERRLKGVDQPALCFQALQENGHWLSRRTPFVGRRAELDVLAEHWQATAPGTPRAVLVSGEAGIGKTRLIKEFRQSLAATNHKRVTWRCMPDQVDIAWHPVISALQKNVSSPAVRQIADPVARLEAILPKSMPRDTALPAMAHMLDMTCDALNTVSYPSAEARRIAYLELMVNALVLQSCEQPLLLIVEDVQWVDVATLEALSQLMQRTDTGGLLVLLAQRSDPSQAWSCPLAVDTVKLHRLPDADALTLIFRMPGGRELDSNSVQRVIKRSDGVPLFIEESVNLEIDLRQSSTDSSLTDVPLGLIDLLSERLERVGEARETASLAAAIGRQFSVGLLVKASELPVDTVHQHLQTLIDSGFIRCQNIENDTQGWFSHALGRDSAYGVLLPRTRRQHHARIVDVLEQHGVNGKAAPPEQLAKHYTAAENARPAFDNWMAAGVLARRNSEQIEAISHFQRAEQLIDQLPGIDDAERDRLALNLHLALLRCHIVLDGYSSDEAHRHARIAEALAVAGNSEPHIVTARFALSSWLFVRGNIQEALQLAEDCLQRSNAALAQLDDDANPKLRNALTMGAARANWACANMEFHLADFEHAMPRVNHCITQCRQLINLGKAMDQDPLVMCLCYRSWYEWEAGDPDKATVTVDEAVAIARDNGRGFSIALSLAFRAAISLFRGEMDACLEHANESLAISEKSRYATWHAWGLVLRGRARCHNPDERTAGINDIVDGLKRWKISGATVTRPFMLAQLAEACALDQQTDRATESIENALAIVNQHGDRYYESAILRIKGQLLQQQTAQSTADESASRCYKQSMSIARQRGQHGSALRTAIANYRQPDTKAAASRTELELALANIKSGHDTHDPSIARDLLAQ